MSRREREAGVGWGFGACVRNTLRTFLMLTSLSEGRRRKDCSCTSEERQRKSQQLKQGLGRLTCHFVPGTLATLMLAEKTDVSSAPSIDAEALSGEVIGRVCS